MENKKIILMLIIVVLLLGSCRSLNSLKENNKLKNLVLYDDLHYSEMLFFPTEVKDQIGHITIFNLRRNLLYDNRYDNYNLDSLLSEILKGNYLFRCNELEGCFNLSAFIEDDYKKLPFKSFLRKFTKYFDDCDCFMIDYALAGEEKKTVMYFLYLNGYYTVYDDYEIRYFSIKGLRKPIIEEIEVEVIENQ